MKKKIIVLVTSLILLVCGAFSLTACRNGFPKATQLHYVEWSDEAGKISFRIAENTHGYGYIMLGEEKVPAEYRFLGYKCTIQVIIDAKDLDQTSARDDLSDSFSAPDIDSDGKIKCSGNVELFGYDFGEIVLTYKQLQREDFEAWEYSYDWDIDKKLSLGANCKGYCKYKCIVNSYALVNDEGKYVDVVFKWLPEANAFAIYADGITVSEINSSTETLAEGTYEMSGYTVTLNFSKDNLFNEENLVLTYEARP